MPGKRLIVGSVAVGRYTNYGNRLIERATLNLLGVPAETPRFSVFAPISEALLEEINAHDALVITGCTTLQDDPGHQRCFDAQFERITIPRICFGASFYCEPGDTPSLRIARLYDTPIGARDPWTAEYLARHGVPVELIGCPTLLDYADVDAWTAEDCGAVLVSSSPPLAPECLSGITPERIRLVSHDAASAGEPIDAADLFDDASLVVTGRLHAALPAITRGIPTRFFGEPYWHEDYRGYSWGSVRYTLLRHLGIGGNGERDVAYPSQAVRGLKETYRAWREKVLGD